MKTIIQRSVERGMADYGWLKARYSFSFANYYNPNMMNFGALRVLNDDIIAGGAGFGEHPHDNMEIISIPLIGALQHKDSMGEKWVALHTEEVQVMSAGTGITHAEKNFSSSEELNLFQIWIIPNARNHQPTYDQKKFDTNLRKNKLQVLVSSYNDKIEGSLPIHQDAKISRLDLSEGNEFTYSLKSEYHGLYTMIIQGNATIKGTQVSSRDAIGVSQVENVTINAHTDVELLFIEVPMNF